MNRYTIYIHPIDIHAKPLSSDDTTPTVIWNKIIRKYTINTKDNVTINDVEIKAKTLIDKKVEMYSIEEL